MAIPRARVPDLGSWAGLPERNTVSFAKTWRRYCLRHNRLLTRAAPYGADSEPRTSESGCAITYDVLFRSDFVETKDMKHFTRRSLMKSSLMPFAGMLGLPSISEAAQAASSPYRRPKLRITEVRTAEVRVHGYQ